jgi:hypothetical protein
MTKTMGFSRSRGKSDAGQMFRENSVTSGKAARRADIIERTSVRLAEIVVDLISVACPQKPAANLAAWAGIGERAAGHIIKKRNGLSLDSFFRLLNSPIGRDLWDQTWTLAPMPDWHKRRQILLDLAEAEQQAEQAREEYAALKRAAVDGKR